MPKTPPTSRLVFVMAEPSPARCGPTAFITAAVIGAMTEAMPWPMMMNSGAITQYDVSTWSASRRRSARLRRAGARTSWAPASRASTRTSRRAAPSR